MSDLRLRSVEVTDFRSFAGTHTWVLGEGPGLFYLTGINNENTRLTSNGIGKSSLLDAICWCLTGRTTRLLRGGDIINYNARTCSVMVNVEIGDEELSVKRTQSPNTLIMNDNIIDQDQLDKYLRINGVKSLLNTLIIPQFGDTFLDLKPSEKLTLFSEIMELEYWLEKSKQAEEKSKKIKDEITKTEREIATLEGAIVATVSIIKDLQTKSDEFDFFTNEKIKIYENDLISAHSKMRELESEINQHIVILDKVNEDLNKINKEIMNLENKIGELSDEKRAADNEIVALNRDIRHINNDISQLNSLKSICPTCKQSVDAKHLRGENDKLTSKIYDINKEKLDYEKVIEAIWNEQSKLQEENNTFLEKRNEIENKKRNLSRDLTVLESDKRHLTHEINRLNKDLNDKKKQENTYKALIKDKKNSISASEFKIEQKQTLLKNLNEDYIANYYWVNGFKQIRLSIIEQTLRSLEIEVNNNLASMGLIDWTIEFDVERENKGGGITKGFTTFIHDPYGRIVNYESLSGGEGQRVRLAASFGLSNLIMERAGLELKTEFYDEISQHLSSEGIEDMLNTLRDRALNDGRQIVIVDHHSLTYGGFNGSWWVIKDKEGSRIEKR